LNNPFTFIDNLLVIFLDLHGLFLFLGVEPYYRKTWWRKLLYEPFMRGNSKPLSDVLYNVMWRTAKKDVIDEVC
jgi:E3 ubiquitin-protein ligase SHPRH